MIFIIITFYASSNMFGQQNTNKINVDSGYLNQLTDIMNNIKMSKKIKYEDVDTLVALFQENEKKENRFNIYPRDEKDTKAFYDAIKRILKSSLNDTYYITSIFELRFTIKRIVEWGEYLAELPSDIALKNTRDFLKCYKILNKDKKKIILGDLTWIVEKNKLNDFIKSLNGIKSKLYSREIKEIKESLK